MYNTHNKACKPKSRKPAIIEIPKFTPSLHVLPNLLLFCSSRNLAGAIEAPLVSF